MIKDKKQLIKLLAYYTMGDGGVYQQYKNGNAYFAMNMKEIHRDYIEQVYTAILNITSATIKPRNMSGTNKIDNCNRQPQLTLISRVHPFFTKLRKRIYTGKYKGISEHYLKLLDPETLAILYMCDGSLTFKHGKYHDVTLNLKRLSEGDLILLKHYLKLKLGIDWNINRQNQYRYLRLRNKHIPKFMESVSPYITESFTYKLLPEYVNTCCTVNSSQEQSEDGEIV